MLGCLLLEEGQRLLARRLLHEEGQSITIFINAK